MKKAESQSNALELDSWSIFVAVMFLIEKKKERKNLLLIE